MLQRQLEPEVMDTAEEAVDYDSMDHGQVNAAFVDDFLAAAHLGKRPVRSMRVLDVGTGTAQIPIELAGRSFECSIVAIDLAEEMLRLARRNVANAGLNDVIQLESADAKSLPYADGSFDAVISNSIIHHAPQPGIVLGEMFRVLRPGGVIFVRDLMRPESIAEINHLVDTYAGDENDHQRQMFRDSLHAALTVEEVRQLLLDCDQQEASVSQTTDRHWTIAGRRD
ncbi:MAG: class I SAM-dependent methyltransferase [Planctomycetota bacterium]|nr:class I SAM-dependent methyltransferase [Planctomycetota bacterium]